MTVNVPTKAVLMIAGTFALSVAAPSDAHANIFGERKTQEWNMCNWEEIPPHVLNRISRRDDFERILGQMFDYCPDEALGFTDRPTASISGANEDNAGDRVNSGEPSQRGQLGNRPEGPSRAAGSSGSSPSNPGDGGDAGSSPEGPSTAAGPSGSSPSDPGDGGDEGGEQTPDYGLPG